MILYLSSQQHTNLLDFLAEQEDALPIKKMTGNFMLKQFVIYDMRNFSHCTELVLDRIAFGDEDEDFAHAIEEFLTMYNARITVICEGLKESDLLCRALLDAGGQYRHQCGYKGDAGRNPAVSEQSGNGEVFTQGAEKAAKERGTLSVCG